MATARKPKGRYHHGDLRRALLDAALDRLKKGEDVGLREVARRAGVSHTAPYRHFADKDALLAAVAEEGFRELRRTLLETRERSGPEPRVRYLACATAYVRFAVEHAAHYRVMFATEHTMTDPPESLGTAGREAFAVLLDLIAEMQRVGLIRKGPLHDIALTLWSLEHGLAMLLLDSRLGMMEPASIEERSRVVHATLLEGLAPPPSKKR